jgi:hypothetical protein
MSEKIDPKKAVYLEPGQRRLPGSKECKAQTDAGQWVEHRSGVALDEWGVAIRALQKARVMPERDRSF